MGCQRVGEPFSKNVNEKTHSHCPSLASPVRTVLSDLGGEEPCQTSRTTLAAPVINEHP